jgi:hypothetical protein
MSTREPRTLGKLLGSRREKCHILVLREVLESHAGSFRGIHDVLAIDWLDVRVVLHCCYNRTFRRKSSVSPNKCRKSKMRRW